MSGENLLSASLSVGIEQWRPHGLILLILGFLWHSNRSGPVWEEVGCHSQSNTGLLKSVLPMWYPLLSSLKCLLLSKDTLPLALKGFWTCFHHNWVGLWISEDLQNLICKASQSLSWTMERETSVRTPFLQDLVNKNVEMLCRSRFMGLLGHKVMFIGYPDAMLGVQVWSLSAWLMTRLFVCFFLKDGKK